MRRLAPALIIVLLAAACAAPRARTRRDALRSACQYLWSRQSADGGWRSGTYGLLRSGQSLTPFVLDALLAVPEQTYRPPAEAIDRALAFLKRNTNREGALGKIDPLLYDYPNYSTALAVVALRRAGRTGWRADAAPLIGWLRTQQFSEARGWKPGDSPYGGWGIGGEARDAPYPGHVDLSMTRHALQALAAAGVAPDDPAFTRARVFVEHCRNPDGGFFFSPVVLDANKAGREGERYRSYGTATADGILSLEALGAAEDDERLCAARRWLIARDRPDAAPGFPGPAYGRWSAGLRFYYAGVGAAALGRCSRELAAGLIATQRADGSWRNPEKLVKEDDPLIATPFAVMALAAPGS